VNPEKQDDLDDEDELYDDEDYDFDEDANVDGQVLDENGAIEREAVLQEHIFPAQLKVKEDLDKDPSKMFYVRVVNFPDIYTEKNILRFLNKKIPNFKHSKLILEEKKGVKK